MTGSIRNELIAVGAVYVDINCPEFPLRDGLRPESEVVGDHYALAPGGSAVNFALRCRSLGLIPRLIGKAGADEMGQLLVKMLRNSGVRPDLILDESLTTNLSMNLVDSAGRSIMTVVGNANQSLSVGEVVERARGNLERCSYLYLGGCFKLRKLLPAFEEIARSAKARGVRVILDHGRLNRGVTRDEAKTVRRLAGLADYYLPSRHELLDLWEAGSIEECLPKLTPALGGTIVVKDGERGAWAIVDGQPIPVPAFAVTPLHTVGAGDSFNAGLIAAINCGADLLDAVRFGCATAALSISALSPPTYAAVTEFLRTATEMA